MKIYVSRTSTNGNGLITGGNHDPQPCEGVTLEERVNDKGETEGRWFIEVSSLDDYTVFLRSFGLQTFKVFCPPVGEMFPAGDMYIEIADDYDD